MVQKFRFGTPIKTEATVAELSAIKVNSTEDAAPLARYVNLDFEKGMGVGGWLCAVCGFMGIIYSFILTGNQVYIEVCVIDGDGEFVLFCVADVIADI